MENRKSTLDKELEKSIFRGWESPNAKNATDIEIQNAKMHWGFATAMDNYFCGSPDSKKFVQALQSADFSDDWPSCERETAIARLAIKKKLRMWGEPQAQLKPRVQSILNTFIAVYHSVRDSQEI
ncbi:MAG: hypothetical protein FJX71_05940 [Alphaproteobacteria bacterium]|nr:hypothetical protein [Alphaproteobacteria bacterium]